MSDKGCVHFLNVAPGSVPCGSPDKFASIAREKPALVELSLTILTRKGAPAPPRWGMHPDGSRPGVARVQARQTVAPLTARAAQPAQRRSAHTAPAAAAQIARPRPRDATLSVLAGVPAGNGLSPVHIARSSGAPRRHVYQPMAST